MRNYKDDNERIRSQIQTINALRLTDVNKAKREEDKLVLSLSYLVRSAVVKYRRFHNYEDLYQEGMIGLIKAVRNYDDALTFHFMRYGMWWIKSRVSRSLKKMALVAITGDHKMYEPIQNDSVGLVEHNTPEKQVSERESRVNLYIALNSLSDREKEVIQMRYGFNDMDEHSFQSMGSKFQLTREGIRQFEHRILNKLKASDIINE